MARKLQFEYIKRLFVLLLLAMLVFLLGGLAELHRRQTEPPELKGNVTVLLLAAVLNSLPALVALAVIPWLASRFIHALYDTKDLREAHGFLHRNVFGMATLQPMLIVKEGRIAVGVGSLYDRVGGRGFIVVEHDSAVVLERGGRLTRIVGGPHLGFLERFERVWEVVDLRPQHWLLNVNGMTKEGIPVSCQADITFKIDDRFIDRGGIVRRKSPVATEIQPVTDETIEAALKGGGIANPLPYTDEAVFKAATSIWVRIRQPDHPEQVRKWTGRVVIGMVDGALRSILARYRLDWLIQSPQPGHKHPREEIRELLERKLRDALPVGNELGARILHVDLGQIDVKDQKISTQWVEAWQAGWEQRAVESLAEGEAKLARLQAAQVQAQAEMVLTLTEAIRPLVTGAEEFPSYLLAMRFVETLRWMAYDPWRRVFLPPETLRMLGELEKMLGGAGISQDETLPGIGRPLIEGRDK
jgi:regulator of protease activity HflC (stomatin/prohibitin superfamily)